MSARNGASRLRLPRRVKKLLERALQRRRLDERGWRDLDRFKRKATRGQEGIMAKAEGGVPDGALQRVHRILHEFTGRPCRDDGGWCDARDHAEAIVEALASAPPSSPSGLEGLEALVARWRERGNTLAHMLDRHGSRRCWECADELESALRAPAARSGGKQ